MWIVFALLAALSAAAVVTLSKAGLRDVNSNLGFAVQAVMIVTVSWIVVITQGIQEEISKIDRRAWIYLLLAGVITCLSSLFSFRALKLGDASQVSSLDKISLVFAIIMAVIFLKEKLTWHIVIGGLLMAVGAVVISMSNRAN